VPYESIKPFHLIMFLCYEHQKYENIKINEGKMINVLTVDASSRPKVEEDNNLS
jgi:hypothetical protein